MLIPTVDMKEFQKIGFKKCKKPYNNCYYLCFSHGCQYIFLSPVMIAINKWEDNDPRIHKKANCKYRDCRTAIEFLCELIQANMVTCDYLERTKRASRYKLNNTR